MLRRCLKKSVPAWTSEKGSAQIIEFSYVFPIVLLTVAGLLYLIFLLFFHVYAFHVTEDAAETVSRNVGGGRLYWQLSAHSADPEALAESKAEMDRRLTGMQVMPGLRFSSDLKEAGGGRRVIATASCSFRGKALFSVRSERALRKPTEFAESVDLAEDMAEDTGLKEFLQRRFGRYIPNDKDYL